jgi:hypothetical protein
LAIFSQALIYGWVSKYRDTIPYTILKIILINKKKNDKYFINILISLVDKDNKKQFIFNVDLLSIHQPVFIFIKQDSMKVLRILCFQRMRKKIKSNLK